jgi:hypothetical protein
MGIDYLNPEPDKRIKKELGVSNVFILIAAPLLVVIPMVFAAFPQPAGYVLAAVCLYAPPLISWRLQKAAQHRYDLEGRTDPKILERLAKINVSRVVYLLLATAALGGFMPNRVDAWRETRSFHEQAVVTTDAITVSDACMQWSENHAGRFPATVDELPARIRALIKSVVEQREAKFIYNGAGIGRNDGWVAIFYSSSDFGNRGRVIAWSDGQVEFVEQVNPPAPVHPQ